MINSCSKQGDNRLQIVILITTFLKFESSRPPYQSIKAWGGGRAVFFTDEAPLIYRDKREEKDDKTAQSSGMRGCILYFYIRERRFRGTLGNALTY